MQPKFDVEECRIQSIDTNWQRYWDCWNKKKPPAIIRKDEDWGE